VRSPPPSDGSRSCPTPTDQYLSTVPTTASPAPGSGTRRPPDATTGPPACPPSALESERVHRLRRRTLTKDRGEWPISHPGHDATGARSYSATRITHAGKIRYEHDAQGRIILRQRTALSGKPDAWRYRWDAEDRLIAVITPDGTEWHYHYDPLGRRTTKLRLAADGKTVVERADFTWDGNTLCEQTTQAQHLPNRVTLTWDHQDVRPLAQTERILTAEDSQDEFDCRFFAVVTDLVGRPTELLDDAGNIAWHSRATLWGTTTWSTTATAYTPLRFPGQYHDLETGLHYNYFRYYEPETARYLTPDPLGLAPAPNPAGYVINPLGWIDPLGLAPGTCPRTGQQINPRGYTSLYEMQLDPKDFGRSRSVHFNRANTSLDEAIKADPKLGKYLDQFSPGLTDAVSAEGGRRTPAGHTWQHEPMANAGGRQGVMRLVPTYQHSPGSPWWNVLHPGNSGGYAEWAVPNGAPPNRRK
jgi:RHS repeat-associated protein